jgi:hypothetical protein
MHLVGIGCNPTLDLGQFLPPGMTPFGERDLSRFHGLARSPILRSARLDSDQLVGLAISYTGYKPALPWVARRYMVISWIRKFRTKLSRNMRI